MNNKLYVIAYNALKNEIDEVLSYVKELIDQNKLDDVADAIEIIGGLPDLYVDMLRNQSKKGGN